jgi:hypothetical protein
MLELLIVCAFVSCNARVSPPFAAHEAITAAVTLSVSHSQSSRRTAQKLSKEARLYRHRSLCLNTLYLIIYHIVNPEVDAGPLLEVSRAVCENVL